LAPTSLPHTVKTLRTEAGNRAFYPALDGLRAVAFFLVFFQHYYSIPWGWTGVNIFFVLSGFLITGILYDSRDAAHAARNFYIRRTLRIFPLYYGVFLVVLLLDPVFRWRWSLSWLAWPLYLGNFLRFVSPSVLTDGSPMQLAANAWLRTPRAPHLTIYLGHFWSLCVEEQFYLFWPWIVFWVRSRRVLVWLCGLVVILVTILRLFAQHYAPGWMLQGELLHVATPFQLDALLLGGLVALLLRGPHSRRVFEIGKVVALYSTFMIVSILAIGIAQSFPNWRIGYLYPAWRFTWGLTIFDLFAASIIICALQPSGPVYRLLNLRPLRWIGRISYGAYVFHDILHSLFRNMVADAGIHCHFIANNAELVVLLLGLTSTLLLSWLSFRFFESKILRLKERWTILSDRAIIPGQPPD